MRKALSLILVLLLCLSLFACSKQSQTAPKETNATQPSTQATDPSVGFLQSVPDLSNFDSVLQLWNSYDHLKQTLGGNKVLYLSCASKDSISISQSVETSKLSVLTTKKNGDTWQWVYSKDGALASHYRKILSKKSYYAVSIDNASHWREYSYYTIGNILSLQVSVRDNLLTIEAYDQEPTKITTEEQANAVVQNLLNTISQDIRTEMGIPSKLVFPYKLLIKGESTTVSVSTIGGNFSVKYIEAAE